MAGADQAGMGAPSVAGDDVYLGWSETRRGDNEAVVCLSAADGKEKWRHTYKVGPYWERNIGWAPGGQVGEAPVCCAGP